MRSISWRQQSDRIRAIHIAPIEIDPQPILAIPRYTFDLIPQAIVSQLYVKGAKLRSGCLYIEILEIPQGYSQDPAIFTAWIFSIRTATTICTISLRLNLNRSLSYRNRRRTSFSGRFGIAIREVSDWYAKHRARRNSQWPIGNRTNQPEYLARSLELVGLRSRLLQGPAK